MDFRERLQRAAEHAGLRWKQADVSRSLGVSRQTVFQWFYGTIPESPMIAHIAKSWRVDPTWLATGEGQMVRSPSVTGLSNEERDLILFYRTAQPSRRKAIYDMAKALRKAVVVLVLTVPALVPEQAEAFNINILHIAFHWLRRLLGQRLVMIS